LHGVGEIKAFLEILVFTPVQIAICTLIDTVFHQLLFVFPPVWLCSLALDIYTTRLFYRKDKEDFVEKERNMIYAWLVGRYGFWTGSLMQILLVEVPLILVLAGFPIPLMYRFLTEKYPETLFSIAAGMALLSAAHLHAAYINISSSENDVGQNA